MKNCTLVLCACLCIFTSLSIQAQKASSAKIYLFKNYPAVINCTEAQLAELFNHGNNVEVSLPLTSDLTLKGPVKWWAKKYSNLQTVSLKLTAFHNILFSVSRRYDAADNFTYVGHLYHTDFADGYELKKVGGTSYQFVKIETDRILQLCSK
ncbi:MAG TPA: hypothetical protein PLY34_10130 [Ferruginibacter sp.]|nr:hypothetical protein [Ferruginibacter sp.]